MPCAVPVACSKISCEKCRPALQPPAPTATPAPGPQEDHCRHEAHPIRPDDVPCPDRRGRFRRGTDLARHDRWRPLHRRGGPHAARCATPDRAAAARHRAARPATARRQRDGPVQRRAVHRQLRGGADHRPCLTGHLDPGAAPGRGRLPGQTDQPAPAAGRAVALHETRRPEGRSRQHGRHRFGGRPFRPPVGQFGADAPALRAGVAGGGDGRHGVHHR